MVHIQLSRARLKQFTANTRLWHSEMPRTTNSPNNESTQLSCPWLHCPSVGFCDALYSAKPSVQATRDLSVPTEASQASRFLLLGCTRHTSLGCSGQKKSRATCRRRSQMYILLNYPFILFFLWTTWTYDLTHVLSLLFTSRRHQENRCTMFPYSLGIGREGKPLATRDIQTINLTGATTVATGTRSFFLATNEANDIGIRDASDGNVEPWWGDLGKFRPSITGNVVDVNGFMKSPQVAFFIPSAADENAIIYTDHRVIGSRRQHGTLFSPLLTFNIVTINWGQFSVAIKATRNINILWPGNGGVLWSTRRWHGSNGLPGITFGIVNFTRRILSRRYEFIVKWSTQSVKHVTTRYKLKSTSCTIHGSNCWPWIAYWVILKAIRVNLFSHALVKASTDDEELILVYNGAKVTLFNVRNSCKVLPFSVALAGFQISNFICDATHCKSTHLKDGQFHASRIEERAKKGLLVAQNETASHVYPFIKACLHLAWL